MPTPYPTHTKAPTPPKTATTAQETAYPQKADSAAAREKKTYIRARKLLGTLGTTKLYIYNHMYINNKNTKKRYPANTNLLGTDWVPLGTLLFSYTYTLNKRAVPTGTHVKICVWVPTNPITTRLAGAVPRVPSVPSVFLYIYGFFWGAGGLRAGRFSRHQPKLATQ